MEDLEKIVKSMDEKGLLDNDGCIISEITMSKILKGYEKYKVETDFWKLIRKAVYSYAIEMAVENHFLHVEEIVDVNDMQLSDEMEDRVLKILLVDFFNEIVFLSGVPYTKSALTAFLKAAEKGDVKMKISSEVRRFSFKYACDFAGLEDILCNI